MTTLDLSPQQAARPGRRCDFSPCRRWRYTLWQDLDPSAPRDLCAFSGLNPSRADEEINDPTVTREIGYARRWGFRRYVKVNVGAYRATDPAVWKRAPDPIGPKNDDYILAVAAEAEIFICAWGFHAAFMGREESVVRLLTGAGYGDKLYALALTKGGSPRHPLYLRGDLRPLPLAELRDRERARWASPGLVGVPAPDGTLHGSDDR